MNKNSAANPECDVRANRRARARGQTRPQAHLCNWITPFRCCEAAEVVLESGLGYCRAHATAVVANREWLRQFFAQWQDERARRTSAQETETLSH